MENKLSVAHIFIHVFFVGFLFSSREMIAAVGITSYTPTAIVYNSSDNKTVVCSTALTGNSGQIVLARYLSTGALDATFGTAGLVTTTLSGSTLNVTCLVISSGNIFVGGSAYDGSTTKFMLAKYTYSTGAIVGAFGSSGIATTTIPSNAIVQKLQAQSDGKIMAIGTSNSNGYNYATIARYNQTTGALDTTYNSSGSQPGVVTVSNYYFNVTSAVIDASNNLVIGGGDISTGPLLVYLTRYNSSGVLDGTFGTSGVATSAIGTSSQANALALDASSKILVGGNSDGQFFAARYTSAGALDTTFNTTGYNVTLMGTSDNVTEVISTGTKVLLAGSTQISNLNNFALAQFTSTGILDTTFNTTGKVTTAYCGATGLFDAVIDSSSNIYGLAAQNNGVLLARYTSTGAVDSTFGSNGLFNAPAPSCSATTGGSSSASYVYLYSTATQNASASSFIALTFNNNGGSPLMSSDWFFDSSTNTLTVGKAGVYGITATINYQATSAITSIAISLIVLKNGVEISGSQVSQTVSLAANNVNNLTKTVIASCNAGDTLRFQWRSNSANVRLFAAGNSSLGTPILTSAFASVYGLG